MHRHHVRGVMDENGKLGRGITREFFADLIFVSDQDDFHPMLFGGLIGSFYNVSRGEIPPHRIHSNLHYPYLFLYLFFFFDMDDLFSPVDPAMRANMVWQNGLMTLGTERIGR